MGVRGRKPKPTAVKVLAGNPGKRPLNESEPAPRAPTAQELRPPKGKLPRDGSELWRALAPQLAELGVLKHTDLPAFEVLCLHYAMVRKAWTMVAKEGLTSDTAMGVKKHPATSVFRENAMAFKGWLTEFGLTPSSRARIHAEPGGEEESLADLLFRPVTPQDDD